VNFGAFVDLGGVDGLVHVSELSWKHIDHPSEVVEVGDEVEVEVLDVDLQRERVSLSLKNTQEDPWARFAREHDVESVVPGEVTKLVPFGAFVKVADGIEGLVHISELSDQHVEAPEAVVNVGDKVEVRVIDVDSVRRRVSLSLKQSSDSPSAPSASASASASAPAEEAPPQAAYTAGGDDSAGTSTMAAALAQAGLSRSVAPAPEPVAAVEQADEPAEAPVADAPVADAPTADAPATEDDVQTS
jgi:small subunit ribosomal protein S1